MAKSSMVLRQTEAQRHERSTAVQEALPCAGAGHTGASLQIVCAWCQQPLRWHQVPTPLPLQTSYGICPACLVQVLRELGVRIAAPPQTAAVPDAACRAGQGGARRSAPVSADTPPSAVQADPLPASGGACLQRVRDTRLHAQVLRAVARDARQRAKAVQEAACHSHTLACAVGVVHHYLSTHLSSQTCLHPLPSAVNVRLTGTRRCYRSPCQ
jgi:hypothetical protein